MSQTRLDFWFIHTNYKAWDITRHVSWVIVAEAWNYLVSFHADFPLQTPQPYDTKSGSQMICLKKAVSKPTWRCFIPTTQRSTQ